eukprot:2521587-Rhodomonas_salina.1
MSAMMDVKMRETVMDPQVAELKLSHSQLEAKLEETRNSVEDRVRQATHAARSDLLAERREKREERRRRKETIGRFRRASEVLGKIRQAVRGPRNRMRQKIMDTLVKVDDITEERIQREWDAIVMEEDDE